MSDARRPLFLRTRFRLLLLAALLCLPGAAEEGKAEREDRLNGLIESLNATSDRRAAAIESIYNELKGAYTREMQEILRASLRRTNSLILQGAVESMAMFGDARDLPAIEALLAVTSSLEVRNLALRLLPAFCLATERSRFMYIRYAGDYDALPSPAILAPLRRPPLTRRGRFDPAMDRLRSSIAAALAGQFDPVAAALAHADNPDLVESVRAAAEHFVGQALGKDSARWRDIWANQGDSISFLSPSEVEEIRLSALQSLSDMGAEGTPDIVAALDKLSRTAGDVLSQALFDAMAAMCRVAYAETAELAAIVFDPADEREGGAWRARQAASAAGLAVFASGAAERAMTPAADMATFGAAAACLGAALSRPIDFPDPDGGIEAARKTGMAFLERFLLMPDLEWERRAAIVRAMGDAGLPEGVAAIMGILRSPYASPEFGTGGLRFADAAIDSLAAMAARRLEARDDARAALLELLADKREFPPVRRDGMPVAMAHMVLWRLQRMGRSNEASLDAGFWRARLGWEAAFRRQ